MGEDKDNKSFEDIINELNSLLDKIPSMMDELSKSGGDKKQDSSSQEKSQQTFDSSDKTPDLSNNKIEDIIIDPFVEENKIEPDKKTDDVVLNELNNAAEIKESKEAQTMDQNNDDGVDVSLGYEKEKELEIGDIKLEDVETDIGKVEIEDNIENFEKKDAEGSEKDLSSADITVDINKEDHAEISVSDENTDKSNRDVDMQKPELDNIEIENLELEDLTVKFSSGETSVLGSESIEIEKSISSDTTSDSAGLYGISEEAKKLINAKKPDNVSEERVKKIGVVYAWNDESIVVNFVRYLDEICLQSKDKKMFVERSFFMIYDENFSVENLMINVSSFKVHAVVVAGELPPDKMYEIENACVGDGVLFYNVKMSDFSKSSVIDFILDLIAAGV